MTNATLGYILGALLIVTVIFGSWRAIYVWRKNRRRSRQRQYLDITDTKP